jgi:hypothetical protein
MPKQEKVTLQINGTNADPDNPKFTMAGPIVDGEVLTFKNDKQNDGIDVEFTIQNTGEVVYSFASMADAVRATNGKLKHGSHCPASTDKWPGFCATAGGNGATLTIFNPNQHYEYFGFALFVTYPGNKGQLVAYDPVGNNQNGGIPFLDAG